MIFNYFQRPNPTTDTQLPAPTGPTDPDDETDSGTGPSPRVVTELTGPEPDRGGVVLDGAVDSGQ